MAETVMEEDLDSEEGEDTENLPSVEILVSEEDRNSAGVEKTQTSATNATKQATGLRSAPRQWAGPEADLEEEEEEALQEVLVDATNAEDQGTGPENAEGAAEYL